MIAPRRTRSLLTAAVCFAAIGCSGSLDDLPREPVAGTVTMDDQPLAEAFIQFYPTGDAAKTQAVGANAEIKDGKFSIPREDGPVPGSYRVSISHAALKEVRAKGKINTSIPNRNKTVGPEQIPARYNTSSELRAEVKPGGSGDLEFKLQSK